MPVISKISVQKKNKHRYNLFLDRGQGEEYAFSVDEDLLIKYQLKKGLDIDDDELRTLIDEDEKKKCYHLAIHYLSYRMRAIEEIRQYLKKKEREESHIEAVIKQLIDQGLLNDFEFSLAYIRSKQLTLMKGPNKLKQELIQKGVASALIDEAMCSFSYNDQLEQVIAWLEKKKARNHKESQQAYVDKLSNQLVHKGYSFQLIKEAISQVDFSSEPNEEWDALCHQAEKLKRKLDKYKGWEYKQRMKQALYRKGFSLELIDTFLEKEDED